MVLLNFLRAIKDFSLKYRQIIVLAILAWLVWALGLEKQGLILAFLIWSFWAFGLGMLGGWFLARGSLSSFPEIKNTDRILILAPHIDDEVISCAGLIQEAVKIGAKVLVVYATNGDSHLASVLAKSRTFDPNDFIDLGEKRMAEAKEATIILGLKPESSVFLGYPDRGLGQMLYKFFAQETPYTSTGTRFNYNPYKNTYREKQSYAGTNLLIDLNDIVDDFKPTIAIVPHPRDNHIDHKSLYYFWEKLITEKEIFIKEYAYLVHFRLYPPAKKLDEDDFLYPPKQLFSEEGWYSFDLTLEQQENKLKAVRQNSSQLKTIDSSQALLESFVKRNEIFEKIE